MLYNEIGLRKIKQANNVIVTLKPVESDILKFMRYNPEHGYKSFSDISGKFVSQYDYDEKNVKYYINNLSAKGILKPKIKDDLIYFGINENINSKNGDAP